MPKNKTFTEKEKNEIIRMKAEGIAVSQIAAAVRRSDSAIFDLLKKHKGDLNVAQSEKDAKLVSAQAGSVFRIPDEKKPDEQNKAAEEPPKPEEKNTKPTPAMDVSLKPASETTYSIEHNSGMILFMKATEEALGKMKSGMADQLFHQFMQDLEVVPVIQEIRAKYRDTYERKEWSLVKFLKSSAEMMAFQIHRVEDVFPSPDSFVPPDKKGFDMGEFMKIMMTMKMLENL